MKLIKYEHVKTKPETIKLKLKTKSGKIVYFNVKKIEGVNIT